MVKYKYYVAKGLRREELMYIKSFMERYEMNMFFKMCGFFHELTYNVAEHFNFQYCKDESENVMAYLRELEKNRKRKVTEINLCFHCVNKKRIISYNTSNSFLILLEVA